MASVTQQPGGGAEGGKGKKGKPKPTKLNVEDFVGQNNFKMIDSSWADIMEDEDVLVPNVSLPSAPKSTLGPEVDISLIPNVGPFKLQVANLHYEVSEGQLADMFKHLQVSTLRLNSENGRMTGTASVEFVTRQDLIDALELNNKQLIGRSVRIFLPNMDRFGGDGRRGGGGGGRSYVDNTPSNWRSATRPEPSSTGRPEKVFPPPSVGYGGGGGGGGREDRGYGRRDGGGFGGRREGGGGGDGDYSRPPRNDFGSGGYGGGRRDFGDGERRGGDDFGRRDGGGRRDRYGDGEGGGRADGNWGRGAPRREESAPSEGGPEPSESGGAGGGGGWRRDGPRDGPPPADRDFSRRDTNNRNYGRDRDGMPPPSRDGGYGGGGRDSFRGRDRDDGGGYERRDRDFERRGPPPSQQGDDLYDPPRRSGGGGGDDYEQPRSFAPPAPPRDRTYSGRSDRSNDDQRSSHSGGEQPKEDRRPELRAERLKNLLGGEDEPADKPASYSSIFGSAKPVDTLKRELEIEKRLQEEKEREAAAKAAAAAEAAAAQAAEGGDGAEPGATSASPDSTVAAAGEHRGPRGPRGDGPPRMGGGRRENGDRPPRRDGERGGERRFGDGDRGDRNGGFGRRDGGDRRMGGGDGERRMGPRRDGGPPGDRRGPRDGGGDRFRDGGERGHYGGGGGGGRFRDGESGGGGGGGGPRYQQERNFYSHRRPEFGDNFGGDRSRFTSEGEDDKEKLSYTTPNKFGVFNDDQEE